MNNVLRIGQKLSEYEIDAMLVTSPPGRLFATGFASTAGVLFVTEKEAWFIVDSRYSEAAGEIIKDAIILPLRKSEKFEDKIEAVIKETGITALGFEDAKVTFYNHKKWTELFTEKHGVKLEPAQELLNELRNIKSRAELDKMIAAQRLSEKIFNEVLSLISTEITEKELAAELVYRARRSGADKESFDPIVVSGPNSSRPHGVPGDGKITKGFITIDFGVCLDGWCSDTTRTFCIGKPDEEMSKIYDTVLRAQLAGIAAVHGGVRGADVDAAARKIIEEAGYGEYFGHGFSHSLGVEVHESLSASPLSKDVLPAGAVISAEPGIYLPGRFGVRIEDTLYITENGSENITSLPKELIIL